MRKRSSGGWTIAALTLGWSLATLPGAAAGEAGRVAEFLADLQRAANAEQAAAAVKKAALSEAEWAQVAKELESLAWKGKLDTFKRTVSPPSGRPRTPSAHKGASVRAVVEETRTLVETERRARLAERDRTLQSRLSRVRAVGGSMARAPVGRSAAAGTMRARHPYLVDPEHAARIDSVEPSMVAVGQTVAIGGVRFGNTAGRVVVLSGEDLFPCEVVSWRDQRIVVRIPRDVRPWSSMRDVPPDVHEEARGGGGAGSGGQSSFEVNSNRFRPATNLVAGLWVKLHGGEIGPMHRIEIGPDLALLTPSIDSVTPSEVEPGSSLLIEGRNFGDQANPEERFLRVTLTFGGSEIRVFPTEWRDGYIAARVDPDVTGVGVLRGGVFRVRNRLGLEAVKGGASFTPAMDVADVERGPYRATCHPLGFPPLCLVGESKTIHAYDAQLRNGWAVQESWVEVVESHSQGANYGGYFEGGPTPGSETLRASVVVWADAYSIVEARFHVLVRGPRGTSFR
ncbi:MAG: hypothetical protein AB1625_03480 [Acidobacteriota bacterium]